MAITNAWIEQHMSQSALSKQLIELSLARKLEKSNLDKFYIAGDTAAAHMLQELCAFERCAHIYIAQSKLLTA